MESLKEKINSIIKGEVSNSSDDLKSRSTDASFFEIAPGLVVFPKDADDLKKLVRLVSKKEGVSLTMRSGATGMDGGALTESIVVDLNRHLNKIFDVKDFFDTHDPRVKGSIKVEPGAFYRDFEKKTLAKNLLMPSFPASREICTVGGMAANNAGGELSLQYGKTEDYIKSLKVIFSDGNEYEVKPLSLRELKIKIAQGDFEGDIYKKVYELVIKNQELLEKAKPDVSKNSTGYYLWNIWNKEKEIFDLGKLIIGSQGTLCIISRIEFKLVSPGKYSQMMVLFLDDLKNLGEITLDVLKYKPTTFESYDDKTLKLALKFFYELLKKLGLKNIFTIIKNGIPEGWSILTKGFPKLILQITFDGSDKKALREKALLLRKKLESYSPRYLEVLKNPEEAKSYWLIRRESFNLLRHKIKNKKTAPFIDDIVVRPEVLSKFLPELNGVLQPYEKDMIYNIAGHIGNGNFHIIPLMDFNLERTREIIPTIAGQVYDLVVKYHGSISGEHNDGLIRTPFLSRQFSSEVLELFRQTKKIFDPEGIFNPGKKVPTEDKLGPGTLNYAISKIKNHN